MISQREQSITTRPRLSVSLLTTVSLLAIARVGHAAESPPAGAATSGVEAPPAGDASVGRIVGHVITVRGRKPVPGAIMRIRENGFETATGDEGDYAFDNLTPGVYTVILTAPNGQTFQQRITVTAGAETRTELDADVVASAQEQLVVLAQRTPKGVARMLQKEAPNLVNVQTYTEIRKLPDVSMAEAVRRVPGTSLETDEGEGRYVNIRGLDADLNSTTFGGLRLPPTNNPSPFGGYRAVTLDSIPIGLVGALTVTESNLPSQDAGALGGTIEITPKTAPGGRASMDMSLVEFGQRSRLRLLLDHLSVIEPFARATGWLYANRSIWSPARAGTRNWLTSSGGGVRSRPSRRRAILKRAATSSAMGPSPFIRLPHCGS